MPDTVSRRITFHHIAFKKDGNNVNDAQPIIGYIHTLPYDANGNGRYLVSESGNARSMDISSERYPIKGMIGTRRVNGLPIQERLGNKRPLILEPGYGLFEPSHFVIFSDNIVAFENNPNGPKSPALKYYIQNKARALVDRVDLTHLLNDDIRSMIAEMGGVKVFRFGFTPNIETQINRFDGGFGAVTTALAEHFEPEEIEIVLKTKSRDGLNIGLGRIPDFLANQEVADNIRKLRVKPIQGGEIDLLSPYIVSSVEVVKQDDRHRSVNSDEMYAAMERAYRQNRDLIDNAIQGTRN